MKKQKKSPLDVLVFTVMEAIMAYDVSKDHRTRHLDGEDCVRCALLSALPTWTRRAVVLALCAGAK